MSEAVQTHTDIDVVCTAINQGHDSCRCTPLMPCWACYYADRRGRPAVRRAA